MTTENKRRFTVIENTEIKTQDFSEKETNNYMSNPMYQKLLNFKNLQDQQKKRFSVDDLFKLC
ncbi:hypothetical protein IJ384_04760 [bacterium]|nr:hypothetical protein [bacterium]